MTLDMVLKEPPETYFVDNQLRKRLLFAHELAQCAVGEAQRMCTCHPAPGCRTFKFSKGKQDLNFLIQEQRFTSTQSCV